VARELVLAAGGIVLRREQPPRIAVVRLRKRDQWVLPKGKLDDGETPRDAARREVLEETGHDVTVHEFLGTLVYEASGRSKVVHYWSMEAGQKPIRKLMNDVRAVDWLPLDDAVGRLSRGHERAFLQNVGPLAVTGLAQRIKSKSVNGISQASMPLNGDAPLINASAPKKRRGQSVVTPHARPVTEPVLAPLQPELVLETEERPSAAANEIVVETPAVVEAAEPAVEMHFDPPATSPHDGGKNIALSEEGKLRSFARKMRDWLVWRFRSPHHSSREFAMRTSEPKPHEINKLLEPISKLPEQDQ